MFFEFFDSFCAENPLLVCNCPYRGRRVALGLGSKGQEGGGEGDSWIQLCQIQASVGEHVKGDEGGLNMRRLIGALQPYCGEGDKSPLLYSSVAAVPILVLDRVQANCSSSS